MRCGVAAAQAGADDDQRRDRVRGARPLSVQATDARVFELGGLLAAAVHFTDGVVDIDEQHLIRPVEHVWDSG